MSGNLIAIAVLFAWPAIAVILYKTMPVTEATIWTLLGALLLLPSDFEIKIPMVPGFNKESIPNVCVVIGCILCAGRQPANARRSGLANVLIAIYVISPLITSLLNNDTILIGNTVLPGVGSYDGISAIISQVVLFSPFLVGRYYFSQTGDAEPLLRALIIAGLIYSLPMLFELRMSPQLSNWIYGYFPSSFATDSRYGGYRPVVFMHNGLVVAFFTTTCFMAAIALGRVGGTIRQLPSSVITGWLGFLVVLCKAGGALVYGLTMGPLTLFTKPRTQVSVAAVLVSIALCYPLLRLENIFPTTTLIETAAFINEDRSLSLQTRFNQEDSLLARASQRLWFGWGRYGRNRVYDENGGDISLTDGFWVITIGQFGIVGFVALFGLLALPVYRARTYLFRGLNNQNGVLWAALVSIVALTMVEQIPNASLGPWSWFLTGVLLGRTECAESQAGRGRLSVKREIVISSRPLKSRSPVKRKSSNNPMVIYF